MPYADPIKAKQYREEWGKNNPEKVRASQRKWEANPKNKITIRTYKKQYNLKNKKLICIKRKQYREENQEKVKACKREYAKKSENRARLGACTTRYRIQKRRTSNFELNNTKNILKVSELARKKTIETGRQYHVDHIAPLQGKSVSGFNVAGNLRVILAHTNQVKTNNYNAKEEALIQRRMVKDWVANGVDFKLSKPKKRRRNV